MSVVIPIAALVIAYILGSIPTGYWLAKAVKGIDIRKEGSGSTGATNVLRCVGKKEAAFVMGFDIFKGYVAVTIAIYLESTFNCNLFGVEGLLPILAGWTSLVGHAKSIFLNFQGGKSVATGLGVYFGLNWAVAICAFTLWALLIFVTRYVSLASILATFSCIPMMWAFGGSVPYIIYSVVTFLIIGFRHTENVKRLIKGTEPKFGKKANKDDSKKEDDSHKSVEAANEKTNQEPTT